MFYFFGSKIIFSFFGQNLAGVNIPFRFELFEKAGRLEVIICHMCLESKFIISDCSIVRGGKPFPQGRWVKSTYFQ